MRITHIRTRTVWKNETLAELEAPHFYHQRDGKIIIPVQGNDENVYELELTYDELAGMLQTLPAYFIANLERESLDHLSQVVGTISRNPVEQWLQAGLKSTEVEKEVVETAAKAANGRRKGVKGVVPAKD